ncbi:hypothetical protein MU1_12320 [Paenibacillus glycanilyticus]|uniref:SLH domain-containing protein n=1 Tax=Paenibacillus glycanilyticus TaxID=126569 RepID=A0ABQ6GC98_9BACL|nr:hypothetical protein MU1_12320 [Paenibacillus glycanilyticus]
MFIAQNGISASYYSATGALTLTSGGATLADWQNALRSITFTSWAVTPNTATRTISFIGIDNLGNSSVAATRTVTVTDTDQTPIVTTTGGIASYTSGASAVTIDSGVTVSDLDNVTQASATVSIGAGFQTGDALSYTNTDTNIFGNIVGSYNSGTGVLTLTSAGATATLAQWQNALRGIHFSTGSIAIPGNRIINFTINDGTKISAAATKSVNVFTGLILTASGGSASFVAGDNSASTPVVIDSGMTVTNGASATLASTTVAITGNFHAGEDVLQFTNDGVTMGNITASYDASTGVLTLSSAGASATLAQWQSALRSVSYTDTAITPNTATRTISFTAIDGGGVTSNAATRSVTVTETDQTPIVTTTGGTVSYQSGSSAVKIDPGVTVSDLDNGTLQSATISITNGFNNRDVLSFYLLSGFSGVYNASTGVLTIYASGGASLSQWQSTLSSVQFSTSATQSGNRTIIFTVYDGIKTSAASTSMVNVSGSPSLAASGGSASFVAGDNSASTPVVIDSGMTVTNGASATLASTTVAITGNFHAGEDVLQFTNDGVTMGNIAASYDASTGVLALSSAGASATLAEWQSALRSVTYTDTAITPDTATRTVSFTAIDDNGVTSNTATRTVTVTAIDQTPIVTTTSGTTGFRSGDTATSIPVAIDNGLTISDLDNGTLVSATASLTGNFHAGEDELSFINDGATMGNITASYNTSTGVLTLTSSGASATLAQWQSAMRAISYTNTAVSPNTATRTVSFTINDGTKSSSSEAKGITLTALSSLSANPTSVSVSVGQTATAVITAQYSDQSTADVTSSVSWTVQNPAIASVTGSTITGKQAGSTVIKGTYGTQSVDITVTVTANSSSVPVTTPAKKLFYDFVDSDRIAAFIRDALNAGGGSNTFRDAANHWASKDISLAARIGIIHGYTDGSFRPDETITRAEFSTIIAKAFALRLGNDKQSFGDTQNSWARESIEILASNGVINGYPKGMFSPDNKITRAEMVGIISKLFILQESKSGTGHTFLDVDAQHWASTIIEEAADAGIIEGKSSNEFKPNDNLTRAEALTAILRVLRLDPAINNLLG